MTDREKLVELLSGVQAGGVALDHEALKANAVQNEEVAEYLIDNGVTVKQTTPERFLEKVKETIRDYGCDVEVMHSVLDELMEDVLIELGYAEAVEHIRDSERWYA